MPLVPKNWQNEPEELYPRDGELPAAHRARVLQYMVDHPGELTPADAAALIDQEVRGGHYVDERSAATAQGVRGRGRDGHRRRRVRNDLPNPRAVGLTNWNSFFVGAVTGYAADDLDDATFSLGGQYGANGHCARQVGDVPAGGSLALQPGRPSGASGATPGNFSVTIGYTLFGRIKVKVDDCPADSTVVLQMRMTDASNGTVTVRTLHTQYPVNSGDVFTLEGFCPATQVRAHLHTYILPSGTGHVAWRVGNAQIVQEPEGDVPQAVDGYHPTGGWDGTADNSTSYAYVWPERHDDDFLGGFNFYHHAHTDNPVDPEFLADLMVEQGMTHLRASLLVGQTVAFPNTKGVDSVWPVGAADPDWTQAAVWPYIEALRARGLRYCPIAMLPTAWMTTDGSYFATKVDPARMGDFIRLHTSLLDAAPDVVDSLEMWNEPNLNTGQDMPPATYTAVMIALYDGIKAQHPDVKIIGGCLSRYQSDGPAGYYSLTTYLDAMYAAGAKGKMDAISVHPYSDDMSTGDPTSAGGFHSGFDQCMREVRQVRHAYGDDATPIWVTEYGWNLSDGGEERRQAQALSLWRGRLARQPDVRAAFFHTLINDRTVGSTVRNFALMELDTMRRRGAFEALRRDGVMTGDRWRPLPLLNSWAGVVGLTHGGVMVRRDGDLVEVRGTVAKTTGAATDVIVTLPDGFCPWEAVTRTIAVFNGSTWVAATVFIRGRNASNAGQVSITGGGSIAAGSQVNLDFAFTADG